jgi:hypothetical protein
MRSRHARLVRAAVLAAIAFPVVGEGREKARAAAPPGEGMEALEAQVARAVDRVSLPHAARLLGRVESARGYRLPGYGVVFVLAPRTLPGGGGQVYVLRGGPPGRHRVQIETGGLGTAGDDVETFERQVLVLQQETEEARRAAEEEMEQLVRDIRVRVASPAEVHVEVAPGPEPQEAPAAPRAPGAPSAPAPVGAPLPPAPPPWKEWFGLETAHEKRTPGAVVADVRTALVDALALQGGRVAGLAGDERVTVAVDFIAGGIFAVQARPGKTLIVSARVKDMEARARGAITAEELRRRIEVAEY